VTEQPIVRTAKFREPTKREREEMKKRRWRQQEERKAAADNQQKEEPKRVSKETLDQMLKEVRGEV